MVTTDDEHIPHAHKLVKRMGTIDVDDPHDMEVSPANDFIAEYVIFSTLTLQIDLFVNLLMYYMDVSISDSTVWE